MVPLFATLSFKSLTNLDIIHNSIKQIFHLPLLIFQLIPSQVTSRNYGNMSAYLFPVAASIDKLCGTDKSLSFLA